MTTSRQPSPCGACGFVCEPDFAFCPRCAAALDMLERVAELSRDWAGRLGQLVTLHVGIHTGPVVAGSLGGGGGAGAAYAVTGDTVNTTARLLAAAAPGTILVSEATYVLV